MDLGGGHRDEEDIEAAAESVDAKACGVFQGHAAPEKALA
jgi:hypothetical protein